jgi:hypothetical protein
MDFPFGNWSATFQKSVFRMFLYVHRRVNNNYHHSWFINHALHESNTSNMTGFLKETKSIRKASKNQTNVEKDIWNLIASPHESCSWGTKAQKQADQIRMACQYPSTPVQSANFTTEIIHHGRHRSRCFYKVVPLSYKLVYNPINYRYIMIYLP